MKNLFSCILSISLSSVSLASTKNQNNKPKNLDNKTYNHAEAEKLFKETMHKQFTTTDREILGHGKLRLGDTVETTKRKIGPELKNYVETLSKSGLSVKIDKGCSIWIFSKNQPNKSSSVLTFKNGYLNSIDIMIEPNTKLLKESFKETYRAAKEKYGKPSVTNGSIKKLSYSSTLNRSWLDKDLRALKLYKNKGFNYGLHYGVNIFSQYDCLPTTVKNPDYISEGI